VKRRQIDRFEKINRLCHSLVDFANVVWGDGSSGACQNQAKLQGCSLITTFWKIYCVRDCTTEKLALVLLNT
jgi:hypothetical protein